MPRIEGADDVLEVLRDEAFDEDVRVGAAYWLLHPELDPDAPRDTFDVCDDCFWAYFWDLPSVDENGMAHPPYEDWIDPDEPYRCTCCGNHLTEDDD